LLGEIPVSAVLTSGPGARRGKSPLEFSYKRGYVVLGGPGWTLREYYVKKIQGHLVGTETVRVVSLEAFVALANEGKL
jgi:hypothetical protein